MHNEFDIIKRKGVGFMKKKRHLFLKIFLSLILIMVLACGGYAILGKQKTLDLTIGSVDLSSIEDGVYRGRYSGFRWSNTVDVTIADHKIINITVVKGQAVAPVTTYDALEKQILEKQDLDVDTVAGATANTKAYLKAVENALKDR